MWSTGINRNIVECKGAFQGALQAFRLVLIETLWNVKDFNFSMFRDPVFVLIETLWNVKMNSKKSWYKVYIVLIETLWNVKTL